MAVFIRGNTAMHDTLFTLSSLLVVFSLPLSIIYFDFDARTNTKMIGITETTNVQSFAYASTNIIKQ